MKAVKFLKFTQIFTLISTALVPGTYLLLFINELSEGAFFGVLFSSDLVFSFFDTVMVPVLYFGIRLVPVFYLLMLFTWALVTRKHQQQTNKKLTAAAMIIPPLAYALMIINEFFSASGELLS